MVLMRGVQTGTLKKILGRINIIKSVYVLCLETNGTSPCLVDSTMLWNQWMRHIGEKGIHDMHNKCMVKGLPYYTVEVELCEHCIYSKQSHVMFSSNVTKAKEILELIHSDVCVPLSIPSLGGY